MGPAQHGEEGLGGVRAGRGVAGSAHGLGVGAVGSELEGDGAEHAQLGGHLLHSAETSLLLRVSKLHHQAGRGTLGTGPPCGQRDRVGVFLPQSPHVLASVPPRVAWPLWEGSHHCAYVKAGRLSSHPPPVPDCARD